VPQHEVQAEERKPSPITGDVLRGSLRLFKEPREADLDRTQPTSDPGYLCTLQGTTSSLASETTAAPDCGSDGTIAAPKDAIDTCAFILPQSHSEASLSVEQRDAAPLTPNVLPLVLLASMPPNRLVSPMGGHRSLSPLPMPRGASPKPGHRVVSPSPPGWHCNGLGHRAASGSPMRERHMPMSTATLAGGVQHLPMPSTSGLSASGPMTSRSLAPEFRSPMPEQQQQQISHSPQPPHRQLLPPSQSQRPCGSPPAPLQTGGNCKPQQQQQQQQVPLVSSRGGERMQPQQPLKTSTVKHSDRELVVADVGSLLDDGSRASTQHHTETTMVTTATAGSSRPPVSSRQTPCNVPNIPPPQALQVRGVIQSPATTAHKLWSQCGGASTPTPAGPPAGRVWGAQVALRQASTPLRQPGSPLRQRGGG